MVITGAWVLMLLISLKKTGRRVMAVVAATTMPKGRERSQTIKSLSGINARKQTSLIVLTVNLLMTTRRIFRCWKIIFVLISPVGTRKCGIQQDFSSGNGNSILYWRRM